MGREKGFTLGHGILHIRVATAPGRPGGALPRLEDAPGEGKHHLPTLLWQRWGSGVAC